MKWTIIYTKIYIPDAIHIQRFVFNKIDLRLFFHAKFFSLFIKKCLPCLCIFLYRENQSWLWNVLPHSKHHKVGSTRWYYILLWRVEYSSEYKYSTLYTYGGFVKIVQAHPTIFDCKGSCWLQAIARIANWEWIDIGDSERVMMVREDVSLRRWLQTASERYNEITFNSPNDVYNYKAPDPWISLMIGAVSFWPRKTSWMHFRELYLKCAQYTIVG